MRFRVETSSLITHFQLDFSYGAHQPQLCRQTARMTMNIRQALLCNSEEAQLIISGQSLPVQREF
jgi:hypothetical protein